MAAPALERCVGDPQRFIDDVWARRPVRYPGADPDSFGDLLALDDVDFMVSSMALRLPAFRLIKDGSTLPESSYTRSGRAGSKPMTGLADPARIFRLFDEGATIVLQGMHRFWLPAARFCRQLEIALGHPTQVNAYITPPGSRGLAVHEDAHDVFVLQAFGSKHWDVWNTHRPGTEPDPAPIPDAAADVEGEPPAISEELQPGDAMYMPRSTPHAARTQETLSGHLTVGILSITWRLLIEGAVQDAVNSSADLDEPLPAGYHRDRAGLASQFEERWSDLRRLLEKTDPARVADDAVERFLTGRPSLLRGGLTSLSQLPSLTDESTVRRRDGSICELTFWNGRLTVLLGDRALTMPARCEPAMQAVAESKGFRVGDLKPYLDRAGRMALVRRLIREGLLEVVGAD